MSQERLGYLTGLTVEQVRTYEEGREIITADRLATIVKALTVEIDTLVRNVLWDVDLLQVLVFYPRFSNSTKASVQRLCADLAKPPERGRD
jgi:transcriptional regulator with XRE-family HTH domain